MKERPVFGARPFLTTPQFTGKVREAALLYGVAQDGLLRRRVLVGFGSRGSSPTPPCVGSDFGLATSATRSEENAEVGKMREGRGMPKSQAGPLERLTDGQGKSTHCKWSVAAASTGTSLLQADDDICNLIRLSTVRSSGTRSASAQKSFPSALPSDGSIADLQAATRQA